MGLNVGFDLVNFTVFPRRILKMFCVQFLSKFLPKRAPVFDRFRRKCMPVFARFTSPVSANGRNGRNGRPFSPVSCRPFGQNGRPFWPNGRNGRNGRLMRPPVSPVLVVRFARFARFNVRFARFRPFRCPFRPFRPFRARFPPVSPVSLPVSPISPVSCETGVRSARLLCPFRPFRPFCPFGAHFRPFRVKTGENGRASKRAKMGRDVYKSEQRMGETGGQCMSKSVRIDVRCGVSAVNPERSVFASVSCGFCDEVFQFFRIFETGENGHKNNGAKSH